MLIFPLAAGAIFVLGSVTELGGVFTGESKKLVSVPSWALATMTVLASVGVAYGTRRAADRLGSGLLVVALCCAALAYAVVLVPLPSLFGDDPRGLSPSDQLMTCWDERSDLQHEVGQVRAPTRCGWRHVLRTEVGPGTLLGPAEPHSDGDEYDPRYP